MTATTLIATGRDAMNALGRFFESVFDPPFQLEPHDEWRLRAALPFIRRLKSFGPGWQRESQVCWGDVGMTIIGARCLQAKELGFIEYRRRAFRSGWWIRLTPLGAKVVEQYAGEDE